MEINLDLDWIKVFFYFFLSVATVAISFLLSNKINFEGKNSFFGPFSSYYCIQIPLFIVPGAFSLSIGLFNGFWFVSNSSSYEYSVGFYLILWTVVSVTFSIVFFSKFIREKYIKIKYVNRIDSSIFFVFLVFFLPILLLVLVLSFSDWPMLNGIIHGDARLRRSIVSSNPSFFLSYLLSFAKFVSYVSASFAGLLLSQKERSRFFIYFLLFLSIAVASWNGAKAPVANCVLLAGFTYFYFTSSKPSFSLLVKMGALAIFVFGLAFTSYWLTMRSSYGNEVWNFFLIRIFAGQMAGLYESLALGVHDIQYIIHGFPFGSHFTELNHYYKDLMYLSEGYSATTGVKNSLFVSEAYGVGGYYLAVISGAVFGFFIIVNARLAQFLLSGFFSRELIAPFLYYLFLYMSLTSEFSSVVLFGRFFVFMTYSLLLVFVLQITLLAFHSVRL